MSLGWELYTLNLEPQNVITGYSRVGVGRPPKIQIPIEGAHFSNKRNCLVATVALGKVLHHIRADAISLLLIVALMFIVVRFSNLLGKSDLNIKSLNTYS